MQTKPPRTILAQLPDRIAAAIARETALAIAAKDKGMWPVRQAHERAIVVLMEVSGLKTEANT